MSLRIRLTVVFGLLSVLMFLLYAAGVLYFVSRTETEAWRGRQQEAALSAATTVATFLEHTHDTLKYLAILDLSSVSEGQDVLDDLIEIRPELLELVRLDSEGRVLAGAFRDRAVIANLFTIPLSQWFLQAREGQQYFGEIQLSAADFPYLILSIAAPDGGVVAGRLDMQVLWQVVSEVRFGSTGEAYVINRYGDVVAHTDADVVLSGTRIDRESDLAVLMDSRDTNWSGQYTNFRGREVVGVTEPVAFTDWTLVAEMSQDEAYASSRSALAVLGGTLLLSVAILMTLSRGMLLRSVVRPMDMLREGTERLGRGDLDYRIRMIQRDEIGQVARAFDAMADKLEARDRELSAQAASLTNEISERQLADHALRESEARYRAIVEDQTDLICRYTADLTLTFVNEAYARYFRRKREDLVGHTFAVLIPEEDQQAVRERFASLDPSNPVITIEHRVLLPDGQIRWMQWTDRILLDSDGSVAEYQAVGRDITERRQAEDEIRRLNATLERRVEERTAQLAAINRELKSEIEERQRIESTLRESQERLQLALRAALAGAWEWDMRSNRAYWSEENFRVMGLDPEKDESHYDTWLRAVHPDDRQATHAAVNLAVETRSDLNIEFRVIWPDGTVRWINDIGRITLDRDGNPIGMYGIQMDITEYRLAIENIRHSLDEKETLLKEIHHRVKNNLQIVTSLLSLQSGTIEDRQALDQFADSQNRIRSMALIHERLYQSETLSQIDFGKYVDDLAASLIQSYNSDNQNITFSNDSDTVLLDIDTAIPCGLIVNELVSNALKHAFPQARSGHIGIEIRSGPSGGIGRLTVWDDGVGLPNGIDIANSTSLGLKLVASLSHQIDGHVSIDSSRGTRFDICFS